MSIPAQFGRYRVLAHLATGGMAQVFVARLEGPGRFQRTVAIKRVLPHLVEDPRFREMFLDEARVTAAIHHAAVAEVYDLVDEGEVYLVMEYVPGETVLRLARAFRKTQTPVPWAIAAHLIAQASAGLHAAHTLRIGSVPQPVIHRDVSPHNILVSYDGDVKVIDFGIAKMRGQEGRTQAGEVKGKFAYMAPEQARSQDLDARTDVFCLGIILWELLAGTRLFGREDEVATLQAVLHEDIIGPQEIEQSIPDELDRIVLSCLERDPEKRPKSAHDLRTQLEAVLAKNDNTTGRADLARLMRTHFEERVATKELLVHGELPSDRIPSLASPTVTEISLIAPPPAELLQQAGTRVNPPRRRTPVWVGVAVAVAVAVPLAWVGASASRGDEAQTVGSPRDTAATTSAATAPRRTEAVVERATLLVQSTPPGAEVFLDGTFLGITPLRWTHDEARAGQLLMRLDGHEPTETPVDLVPGETVTIERTLERTRPAPRVARSGSSRPHTGTPAATPVSTGAPPPERTGEAEPDYFRFE